MEGEPQPERLGPYDKVDVPGLDEHGIPLGEHTLTCGCKMNGRSIVLLCDDHDAMFKHDTDFSSVAHPGVPGQCPYMFKGKTVLMRCGYPEAMKHRHGDWREPGTNKPAVNNPNLL